MELHLRTDGTGPLPVLVVEGEVDLATLPRLRNALVRLVVDHAGSVVAVDLTAVSALDDCGLGVLMGAAAHARGSGATSRSSAPRSGCASGSRSPVSIGR